MKTKRFKKFISLTLTAVVCISALTGCGGKQVSEGYDSDGNIPKNLRIWATLGPSAYANGADSNNDILAFQLMEEMTGCHVEWIHSTGGSTEELFNLMIASGEHPDGICYYWDTVAGGIQDYVDDGVIYDLTEMVAKNMPHFTKYLEDNPEVKKAVTNDEGKIYRIPYIRRDKQLNVYQGMQIRRDWLDAVGMDVPSTTEEFYEVLKAFKEKDPNGNGKSDEIPMTGVSFDNASNGIGNLLWAFGTTYGFHLKDGKVVYGPMEQEFEVGLAYIAKLFNEKLIDIDYLQNDRTKMDGKMLNDQAGVMFGMQPTKYYNNMQGTKMVVEGVPYLSSDYSNSKCFNSMYTSSVINLSIAIPTANKNPGGTLKWLDAFFSEKGVNYMNYGEEGKTYDMIDGEPVFKPELLEVNPELGVTKIGTVVASIDSTFPTLQTWDFYKQTLSPWGQQAIELWASDATDTSAILPALSFTAEENTVVADKLAGINTLFTEAANKVIIGKMSASEWKDVQAKMKNMGIDDVLKVYNDAYVRYLKK